LALVGIRRRGVPLAKRIAAIIKEISHHDVPTGALDITLYRDDLDFKPPRPLEDTSIPEGGIDQTLVVLVDDVLYTGRTIRAAVNELYDFGRPASIALAVLVDRGGRELPIAAACATATIELPADKRIRLARDAAGRLSFEIR
jgi:pyrimidine operon attenuation protein/uracil phosphoribosyltransferase